MTDWMVCESRAPWVTNSLKHRISEMRKNEAACRGAFKNDWMGIPSNYLADVYAEARQVFENALAEVERAKASTIAPAKCQTGDQRS